MVLDIKETSSHFLEFMGHLLLEIILEILLLFPRQQSLVL